LLLTTKDTKSTKARARERQEKDESEEGIIHFIGEGMFEKQGRHYERIIL
jgi:hypothetical protein